MIEDDGRGFDPGASRGDGLGLLGMRERVELLDGTFQDRRRRAGGNDADRRAAGRLTPSLGQPAASRASAASVRPKAGANLNPWPEQADATTMRPCRSSTNDSSAVLV